MCLLVVQKTGRLTEEQIRNAQSNHPDGAGCAWWESDGAHFKKGLTIDETIKLSKELPLGSCFHWRWSSVGGKGEELIHPFTISQDVPLKQEGVAKRLLFHNGHFGAWNQILINHLSNRAVLPRGNWSDTRAIAYLVHTHGAHILQLLDCGKFVVMENNQNLTYGDFIEDGGVLFSNSSYKSYIRGGCGTGIANSNVQTRPGQSYHPVEPTKPKTFNQPSQPLNGPANSQVEKSMNERETMTAEEFAELRAFFEKDNSNLIDNGVEA